MTVKQRLIIFAKTKEKSVRAFEINAGLTIGYINAIRVSIQPDKINSIVSHYPDLNTGWLLTGEGEMLNQPKNNFAQLSNDEIKEMLSNQILQLYESGKIYPAETHHRIISEKDAKIEMLQKRIWELEQENKNLKSK